MQRISLFVDPVHLADLDALVAITGTDRTTEIRKAIAERLDANDATVRRGRKLIQERQQNAGAT